MLGYKCYLIESRTLKIEMISHKMMMLYKDQAQGSAQHRQTIYHLKDFFAGNLMGPIFICHVTLILVPLNSL